MLVSWAKCELLERSQAYVYLAVDRETGKLFVVKTCDCDDKRTTRELLNEITIFLVLETPRVVQYLGSSFTDEDDKKKLNLFLEYMPGGSLRRHISRLGGRLEESLIRTYTRAIIEALHHLHSKGIVHGDIKADNILVGLDGVKLCDFGGSKFLDHDSRGAMRGTPAWMAPEVVAKLDQGFPSDIWSLGCTVLEMATGQDPWGKVPSKTDLRAIQLSRRIPDVSSLSAEGQRFARRCLVRNPRERWTAAQLLEEEFIKREAADAKSSVISPALARIRATFPDLPGKGGAIDEVIRNETPIETRPESVEEGSTVSTFGSLPTSVPQLEQAEGVQIALDVKPAKIEPSVSKRRQNIKHLNSRKNHRHRLSEPIEAKRREIFPTSRDSPRALTESELMNLRGNVRNLNITKAHRDRLLILLESEPQLRGNLSKGKTKAPRDVLESEPLKLKGKARNIDGNQMSSDGPSEMNRETTASTPSESSTLLESTLFPIQRELPNDSGRASQALLDPEKLHEPWETTQEVESATPSDIQLIPTPQESTITPAPRDLSDHSPTIPELEKQQEPWETRKMDNTVPLSNQQGQPQVAPTPSDSEDYFPLRTLRTPQTPIPRPTAFLRDQSDHQLYGDSTTTSRAHPTPIPKPTAESSLGGKEKARNRSSCRCCCCIHWGFHRRPDTPETDSASTMPAPSSASEILSDCSDTSATLDLLDTYNLDNTNLRRRDQMVNTTCPSPALQELEANPQSTPTCESICSRSSSLSASLSACSDRSPASVLTIENSKLYSRDETPCL